jgi:hypothetical protein
MCVPCAGSYSTERLRQLFGEEFLVEDVILKDSRKKKKASALVVLDSVQAAAQAAHQVRGPWVAAGHLECWQLN